MGAFSLIVVINLLNSSMSLIGSVARNFKAPPTVAKQLGSGIPVLSELNQDEYAQYLSQNKILENENLIAFDKSAFGQFGRKRDDIQVTNSSFLQKLANILNLTRLHLVRSAPSNMSGIVILAKSRNYRDDLLKRMRVEQATAKRLCYHMDLLLVGQRCGLGSPELEEPIKFWSRDVKLNGISQRIQTWNVTTSQIRKDQVQLSNGQFSLMKHNNNRAHVVLKADSLFDGLVSLFALKSKWSVLGDHLYSQRLSYLDEAKIKLLDPSKCSVDQVQNLPDDVKKDLNMQRDQIRHLVMFAHFGKFHLPKTKNHDEILIECDKPVYFDAAIEALC